MKVTVATLCVISPLSFRVVSPSSFVYGESVEASQFIQLEDFECHFQPLNFTLQVKHSA